MDEPTVIAKWRELLAAADMENTSEKQLRSKLQKVFPALDIETKSDAAKALKAKLRAETEAYLESTAHQDSEEEEEAEEEVKPKKRGGSAFMTPMYLSPALAALLGADQMPRGQIVKKIWDYVKANNIQDPKDRRSFICDAKLLTIFKPPVCMFSMNKQLQKHMKSSADVFTEEDRKRKGEGSDDVSSSDETAEKVKPKKKRAAAKKGDREKKAGAGNAFTRPEKDLKDPADKRYVIADEALRKLTGKDRFLAFGIQISPTLKYRNVARP
eukprot:gene5532-4166_t